MKDMKEKLPLIDRFLEKYKSQEENCNFCPRKCNVNRNIKTGVCRMPFLPMVASYNLHHGEEPPISGMYGSGTIFLSGCNLRCVYCQNFPISQLNKANKLCSFEELADIMLNLQKRKAHNINFVNPSHYAYQIVKSLKIAIEKGFNIPLVYNTSGYDDYNLIKDLEGIVDIWLPDMKYYDDDIAIKYSNAINYFEIDSKAILEMFRQTDGDLILDENGIAKKGIIIRHLVLPNHIENSKKILKWIRENLGKYIHLAVMAQYFPAYKAIEYSEISRKLSYNEYEEILDYTESLGFENVWMQEYDFSEE